MSNQPTGPTSFGPPPGANQFGSSPGGQFEGGPVFPEQPQKKGCGWGSCALGCLAMLLVSFVVCAGGTFYFFKKLPEIARSTINNVIAESQMSPEDKAEVNAQVDRVISEYQAGRVSGDQLKDIFQKLVESPLFPLLIVFAADEKYVQPSGLPVEEKQEAQLTLQRLARGVFEKKISQDKLEKLQGMISTKQANGQPKFHDSLTDPDLRAFLAACKQAADEANIPEEPFEVRIGHEFKKVVDEALGGPQKLPAEVDAPEIQLDSK